MGGDARYPTRTMKLSNAQIKELNILEQAERLGFVRVTDRCSTNHRTLQVLIRHGLAIDSTPDAGQAHPLITEKGLALIA